MNKKTPIIRSFLLFYEPNLVHLTIYDCGGKSMREINEKIRNAQTDSDLMDIAYEYEIAVNDVFYLRNIFNAQGTACEGCDNIDKKNMYPCIDCGRTHPDHYKSERNKKGF